MSVKVTASTVENQMTDKLSRDVDLYRTWVAKPCMVAGPYDEDGQITWIPAPPNLEERVEALEQRLDILSEKLRNT